MMIVMMILFSDSFREELNEGGVRGGSPPRQPKKRAEANPEKIFMRFGTFFLQNFVDFASNFGEKVRNFLYARCSAGKKSIKNRLKIDSEGSCPPSMLMEAI